MPPRDDQGATVVVIELGPGQIYVKIAEPKPEPQRVEMLLRKTVSTWFSARPEAVIERTQAVVEAGQTLGLQVWFSQNTAEHLTLPPLPAPDISGPLTIAVSEPILQKLPRERLEAVVDEAVQVWHSQPDRHGTLIVVNARRIAVILDMWLSRGAVVPVEEVFAALDEMAREALRAWLASLPNRLHVIQIAENWFEPQSVGWQTGRIAEPNFVRTNMTYDAGTHPRS